jgi:hypothetical protein
MFIYFLDKARYPRAMIRRRTIINQSVSRSLFFFTKEFTPPPPPFLEKWGKTPNL